jgi:LacI family transcriptional regulator
MSQPSTLKQVARRAGVSLSTASLVLNDRPGTRIAADTRRRVRQAARDLNYTTRRLYSQLALHFLAGGPRHRASPYEQLPAFAAAQGEAAQHGVNLQVAFSGKSPADQIACIDRLAGAGAHGVLVATKLAPEAVSRLVEQRIPAVLIGSGRPDPRLSCVHSDNHQGATLLMEHLHALGHRRIAFCGGRPEITYEDHRYVAYQALSLRADFIPPPGWTLWTDEGEQSADAWVDRLLSLPAGDRPTAILGGKLWAGQAAFAALQRRGCRVPDDVSLVVYDDPREEDPDFPPLTCVRRPVEAIWRLAVDRLLEELHKPNLPRVRLVLPVELVVRASSGPPPCVGPRV